MAKPKNKVDSWVATDCGKLDFDVDIEKLLSGARSRSEQEYNAWCSVIGTFVEAIADAKK